MQTKQQELKDLLTAIQRRVNAMTKELQQTNVNRA